MEIAMRQELNRIRKLAGLPESIAPAEKAAATKQFKKDVLAGLQSFDPKIGPHSIKVSGSDRAFKVVISEYGLWFNDTRLKEFFPPRGEGEDAYEWFETTVVPYFQSNLVPILEKALGMKGRAKMRVGEARGFPLPPELSIVFQRPTN